ncbi:RHS repeat-associated core domain-containing protein [Aeromonas jandaei]|uniref:RHS repeat-associated core domain-containing protein n=1 Tax=Aeromonas jandaei TaxID=650 RepID=UPI001ABF2D0C|nr:RHS repeat-associated core domain-containing protein [Aeromonas jandaei]QSR75021.1 RHS repeat-associated core domain-containing protein [Aeromonas jandaei]
MSKTRFFNLMGNSVHSLERRRFLMKGALVPLIPMAAILPGAISMNAVASNSLSTLLILNNGFRFNGVGEDKLLAMQHLGNGYRIYNPMLMRFQAMDSLAPFNEGGVHSYAYVSNDPVNSIDPSGHIGWVMIGVIVGVSLALVGTALIVTSSVVSNNHRNYAESIKPDWTWEYDWTEYDSSMKAADDWGIVGTVGKVLAAVGGLILTVSGAAGGVSSFLKNRKNKRRVGPSISRTTSLRGSRSPSLAPSLRGSPSSSPIRSLRGSPSPSRTPSMYSMGSNSPRIGSDFSRYNPSIRLDRLI